MSGHSKWATIKHKKGAADKARGKLFAKLIRQVEVAARAGGSDLESNATLRTLRPPALPWYMGEIVMPLLLSCPLRTTPFSWPQ